MRVGIDASALIGPRAGIARFLEGIVGALARYNRGHEFVLFACRPAPIDLHNARARVHVFRGLKGTNGALWLQLYGPWLIQRERVDVFWGPTFFLPLLLTPRIPTLVTVHDLVHVLYPQTMETVNYLTLRTLLRPSLWRAQHITADSQATADDLRRQLNVPAGKVSVVYPGVAPQFHVRDPDEAHRHVAAAFGLDGPYLLTVSTLEPRKNLTTLLQAFQALPDTVRRRWPLIVVGYRGWKTSGIYAAAASLVREGSVRILGYVKDGDLPWLYAGAALFLFPSLYEGFGMPVVEAMASGVPVAVSDIPVVREVTDDSALLVPPTDVKAWSAAMHGLVEDPARCHTLREAGLRRATRFTFDESAQRLLSILERLAEGKPVTEPAELAAGPPPACR